MKRGLSGKTRRGPPPVERQRIALRVIQLTFVALAVVLFWFAWSAYRELGATASSISPLEPAPASVSEVVAFVVGGILAVIAALVMGFRAVRGPRPPEI